MEQQLLHQIQEDLRFVKKEVIEIKQHMVDIDSIMTEEDYRALCCYREEKSKGTLVSHEKLKKTLGLSHI